MHLRAFLLFAVTTFVVACVPPYSPTGEDDPTAPRISAVMPADGTADATADTIVTVTFTAPVDPATVTIYSLRLLHEGASVAAVAALSDDGLIATITPEAPLIEGGLYTVAVSRQIRDESEIPLDIGGVDTLFASTFTIAATPPTITAIDPEEEEVVGTDLSGVTVTFSEPMDPATITAATLLVGDMQGTVTYDPVQNSATLTFDGPLSPLRFYTIFVAGTVTDLSGIPMGDDLVSRFITNDE